MEDRSFLNRIEHLRAHFETGDARERLYAALDLRYLCEPLGERATPAIPLLLEFMGHEGEDEQDDDVVMHAALGIGNCGAAGVATLHGLLEGSRPEIRQHAAFVFGQRYDTSTATLEALIALLRREDVESRGAALQALGNIGKYGEPRGATSPYKELFIAALDDPHEDTRYWAAHAVAGLGLPAAKFIALALGLMDRPGPQAGFELFHDLCERLEEGDACAYLPALLRIAEGSTERAVWLVEAFGRMGADGAAAIPLLERLATIDPFTGMDATFALWRIDGRLDVLQLLAENVQRRTGEVADLVAEMGPVAASALRMLAKAVDRAFESEDDELMASLAGAFAALRCTDKIAVSAMRRCLGYESPVVKTSALRGLAVAGPAARSALPEVRALLRDEQDAIRKAARDAIAAIEKPAN